MWIGLEDFSKNQVQSRKAQEYCLGFFLDEHHYLSVIRNNRSKAVIHQIQP
jgi:hypothetical protein